MLQTRCSLDDVMTAHLAEQVWQQILAQGEMFPRLSHRTPTTRTRTYLHTVWIQWWGLYVLSANTDIPQIPVRKCITFSPLPPWRSTPKKRLDDAKQGRELYVGVRDQLVSQKCQDDIKTHLLNSHSKRTGEKFSTMTRLIHQEL